MTEEIARMGEFIGVPGGPERFGPGVPGPIRVSARGGLLNHRMGAGGFKGEVHVSMAQGPAQL
ncbi:MAG: hypothetical protein CMJ86_02000 [Planctomycetes bacterium]|nr:hypothetical protein [Planctomycetota bacterium]